MHTAHRAHGIYDVHKIWKLVDQEPTQWLKMSDIEHALDSEMWTKYYDGSAFTPFELVKTRQVRGEPNHWNRIFDANLNFPIIVLDQDTAPQNIVNQPTDIHRWGARVVGRFDLLDGCHRACKLWLMGAENVSVKLISWDNLQKAKLSPLEYYIMMVAAWFGLKLGKSDLSLLEWNASEWSNAYSRHSVNASREYVNSEEF